MDKTAIEKINKFTRREFEEDELYIFSVILCDNEIDRDYECFSDNALEKIKSLFIGKTGIFDHNTKTANQNARIFDTEIVIDKERKTQKGEDYKYIKAMAYMIRTDENKNLIAEIDGGIKKEVSISCSVPKKICSVCGHEKSKGMCSHVKGKTYSGRVCHTILDDVADAYEWSFVAVPAQINAGVTKKFSDESTEKSAVDFNEIEKELRRDIRRLAFFKGGISSAEAVELSTKGMSTAQLINLKKSYEHLISKKGAEVQLMPDDNKEQSSVYKI